MKTEILAVVLLLIAVNASAQPAEPRRVVFADVGYARTWDDEGLLGTGAAVRAGAGWRLTPRLTLQAVVDRISYYYDVEYLTIEGRFVFVGIEAAFQSRNPTVRRFVTAGAGVMNDDSIWITKRSPDPFLPRVHERSEHHYTLSMMTASGGLDFRVSDRASIRASLRFHGLLDTGDDLAPHMIIQPTIGAAFRW